jgi:hypothetical protein
MEGVAASKLMLFLDCPEEVMEVRMLARGRSDDVTATIKKRCVYICVCVCAWGVRSINPLIDACWHVFVRARSIH